MSEIFAFGKRQILLFCLGFLFLATVAIISVRSGRNLDHIHELRERTEHTLSDSRRLLEAMINIETSQRGFLITHQEVFLEPYREGTHAVPILIRNLRLHLDESEEGSPLLEPLLPVVQRKMEFAARAIDLARARRYADAQALVASGEGKALMDEIRQLLGQLEERVRSEHARQERDSNRQLRQVQGVTLAAILSALLALGFALYLNHVDLRRRQRLENDLSAARKKAEETSQLKTTFLAHMSHEIRTPLNGIIGSVDLLQQTALDPQQTRHAQVVRESSILLLGLINNILDLSKIEAGKLVIEKTFLDLRKVLQHAVNTVRYSAARKGVRIVMDVDGAVPPSLQGDPLRMQQIFMNLLSNAVKFTPAGEVKVKLECLRLGKSQVVIRFLVRDEGIGMSPEILAGLFESFQQGDQSTTRKYGGTGLGLTITRQLVQAMGGEIQVTSSVGRGSTFQFELTFEPLAAESIERQSTLPSEESTPVPLKILVAEDNVINQEVITAMLKRLGHAVRMVDNGKKAAECLGNEDFDLVLMDCHMPEMDGYSATREIRHKLGGKKREITIIAVTANAAQSDQIEALAAGMDDYLSKPIVMQDLKHKLALWSPLRTHPHENVVDADSLHRYVEIHSEFTARESHRRERAELIAVLTVIGRVNAQNFLIESEIIRSRLHALKDHFSKIGLPRLKVLTEKLARIFEAAPVIPPELESMRALELQLRSELKLSDQHLVWTKLATKSAG